MKKLIIGTGLLLIVILGIGGYQFFKFNDGNLHIVFCNVGQGDGILIRTPKGLNIVNDAGPDDSILNCMSRHMPFWDREVKLMILSHPHSDHMSGMISILKDYKVLSFATENLKNTTAIYSKLLLTLASKNLEIQYIYARDLFKTSDGLVFKILGPTKEFISRTTGGIIKESSEDGSLSSLVSIGNFNAMLTGDAPIEELAEEISNISDSKIEVLQIPHHGSRFNSSESLISRISPQFAVISVGKNNYGHPSPETINAIQNLKIKYLRTDQHGDIEIIADKTGKFSLR